VSHDHLINILETLAKVTLSPIESLEALLSRERGNLPWGATLIFVASKVSKPLSAALDSLWECGHRVVLLQVGEMPNEGANCKCKVYKVRPLGDLARVGATLALERMW
jgi:hypothetical protein